MTKRVFFLQLNFLGTTLNFSNSVCSLFHTLLQPLHFLRSAFLCLRDSHCLTRSSHAPRKPWQRNPRRFTTPRRKSSVHECAVTSWRVSKVLKNIHEWAFSTPLGRKSGTSPLKLSSDEIRWPPPHGTKMNPSGQNKAQQSQPRAVTATKHVSLNRNSNGFQGRTF